MTDPLQRRRDSLASLESRHGDFRRRFNLAARDPEAIRRVAELYTLPPWAQSGISMGDAFFLYDLVRAVRPARIVEIGVAAGCSSALLLGAMADVYGTEFPAAPLLISADIHNECFFDRTRPVGAAVEEMVPGLRHMWRLHTGATARDLPHLLSRSRSSGLHLAFIDADHRHPAPIADLLAILPCLAPGAWVALHDIALPEMARLHFARTGNRVEWDEIGPQVLFDRWPFEKVRGELDGERAGSRNIGAIQIPKEMSRSEVLDCLAPALAVPWQVKSGPGLTGLLDSLRAVA